MELLQNIPVEVDVPAILKSVRIKPDSPDGQALAALMETMRPAIKPKVLYRVAYIHAKHAEAVELEGVRLTSKVLRVNLEQAERVFPFVATCGTEVETLSQQETDMLRQYVLDMLKERVLRQAITHLLDHLRATYFPGKLAMMNPGSLADWPLREQVPLFALLGDVKQAIGVELTESFLMSPVKSVSGLIFPTEVTFENCQLCPREGCPGRRATYNALLAQEKYQM